MGQRGEMQQEEWGVQFTRASTHTAGVTVVSGGGGGEKERGGGREGVQHNSVALWLGVNGVNG